MTTTSSSPTTPIHVLHLEDTEADHVLVREMLAAEGLHCDFQLARNREEFEAAVRRNKYDLIISDFSLPSYDGLKALALADEWQKDVPFIFFSGTIGEETAVESLKTGATDYVAAQLDAFRIARSLAEFFETCDIFLCPTLCLPPVKIGELDTMANDLSGITPLLRRYMPATSMFNMSGQPAMSVPLAWNHAGLPLGMMFSARLGDEATLFRLAGQLEQVRPWRDKLPPVCA